MLVTPFNKFDAFKHKLIDKNGMRLDKKAVTSDEKNSINALHRLVFNLKRIITKVPFGKTAFASYAIAIALLKEECNLNADETEQLCEKFYRMLKEENHFHPTMLDEALELNDLHRDLGQKLINYKFYCDKYKIKLKDNKHIKNSFKKFALSHWNKNTTQIMNLK